MSSIEYRVCTKITQRAQVGKEKYGTTMDRKDLTKLQWLKHAQLYLQRKDTPTH